MTPEPIVGGMSCGHCEEAVAEPHPPHCRDSSDPAVALLVPRL